MKLYARLSGKSSSCNQTISCDGDSTFVIKVDLGDLDDTATVSAGVGVRLSGGDGDDVLTGGNGGDKLIGGAGDDRLVGGDGTDELSGGPGDDVIDARDGTEDDIDCGDGNDTVIVDSTEDGVVDCETVDRPK